MPLEILVPVSTEVMEENPEGVISGKYKDGALVISMDARKQDHHTQHGLPRDIESLGEGIYCSSAVIVWIVLPNPI